MILSVQKCNIMQLQIFLHTHYRVNKILACNQGITDRVSSGKLLSEFTQVGVLGAKIWKT